MRRSIHPVPLLVVALVLAAGSAGAQTTVDEARDQFQSQLAQQCPEKQLELLSPGELRDGLDDYKDGLSQQQSDRLQKAETTRCSSMDVGVECVNMADIVTAGQMGRMSDLASSICSDFLGCHDQGACDYAR